MYCHFAVWTFCNAHNAYQRELSIYSRIEIWMFYSVTWNRMCAAMLLLLAFWFWIFLFFAEFTVAIVWCYRCNIIVKCVCRIEFLYFFDGLKLKQWKHVKANRRRSNIWYSNKFCNCAYQSTGSKFLECIAFCIVYAWADVAQFQFGCGLNSMQNTMSQRRIKDGVTSHAILLCALVDK